MLEDIYVVVDRKREFIDEQTSNNRCPETTGGIIYFTYNEGGKDSYKFGGFGYKMIIHKVLIVILFLFIVGCDKLNHHESKLVTSQPVFVEVNTKVVLFGETVGKVTRVEPGLNLDDTITVRWNSDIHFKKPMMFQIIYGKGEVIEDHIDLFPFRFEGSCFLEYAEPTHTNVLTSFKDLKIYFRKLEPASITLDELVAKQNFFLMESETPLRDIDDTSSLIKGIPVIPDSMFLSRINSDSN